MNTLARARGHTFCCRASYELPELGKPIPHPVYRHQTTRRVQPLPPAPIPSEEEAARAVAAFQRMSSAERVLAKCGLTRADVVKMLGGAR